jgi:DeoR family transcriptional regulator, deoxyribose operon repressor
MKKDGRLDEIVQLCEKNGFVSFQQLAKELHVSEITIRRDIDLLETLKLIKKERGGATQINSKVSNPMLHYTIDNSSIYKSDEKKRIGQAAADLVNPGDTLIIDSGSTMNQMAAHIPDGLPISVICFGLRMAQILDNKKISPLIMIGGIYHKQLDMFENISEDTNFFNNVRAEKAFISAFGINKQTGLTSGSFFASSIRKDIIESVDQVILLADSSKFGKIECAHFADIEQLDVIITDKAINKDFVEHFKMLNIQVITV